MKINKKMSLEEIRLMSFTTSKGGDLPNPCSDTYGGYTCGNRFWGNPCGRTYTGCDGDNYCP